MEYPANGIIKNYTLRNSEKDFNSREKVAAYHKALGQLSG